MVEVDTPDLIRPEHLPDLKNVERILFKTANSRFVADTDFHTDYVALGLEAAQALSRAGVILIGIDYFSIEAFKIRGIRYTGAMRKRNNSGGRAGFA